jgi:hypothetical protein
MVLLIRDNRLTGHSWKNLGSEDRSKAGEFVKIADLNMDLSCIPRGLHFVDMNGDGLDDIV